MADEKVALTAGLVERAQLTNLRLYSTPSVRGFAGQPRWLLGSPSPFESSSLFATRRPPARRTETPPEAHHRLFPLPAWPQPSSVPAAAGVRCSVGNPPNIKPSVHTAPLASNFYL